MEGKNPGLIGAEAERFLKEFRERLAKFGLELHTEKTRLIEFGRFAAQNRKRLGKGKPETLTFLGFTHYCGKRLKDGAFIVWRETAKKRLVAKLKAIKLELKRRRHEPIASLGAWLRKVTSGYYQYHAVPGNLHRLQLFRWRLSWVWWRVLSRRSQRSRVSMDRLNRFVARWIPVPRVLHPYPMQRFDARHPRREPYAEKRPYGSVRGAISNGRPYRNTQTAFAPLGHAGKFTVAAVSEQQPERWFDASLALVSWPEGRQTPLTRDH